MAQHLTRYETRYDGSNTRHGRQRRLSARSTVSVATSVASLPLPGWLAPLLRSAPRGRHPRPMPRTHRSHRVRLRQSHGGGWRALWPTRAVGARTLERCCVVYGFILKYSQP